MSLWRLKYNMKFYTIESGNKQYVAVEKGDRKLVTLKSMGVSVNDMNDLIAHYDELYASIRKGLEA